MWIYFDLFIVLRFRTAASSHRRNPGDPLLKAVSKFGPDE
jgi:hypothetical protein